MKRKIYVTEAGYDDIGAILTSLGEGYKFSSFSSDFGQLDKLNKDDILFINCNSACIGSATNIKSQLRNFVAKGGTLYASDWAGSVIEAAFGDFLSFNSDGESQTLNAQVVDSGLKELLGGTISLNFDLGGWWKISQVKKEVKIFLSYQKNPLLVSFKHGEGYVLYTSFHNKSQVSSLEKALLEYLVFRPLLSKVADQALNQATSANYKVDKEIIASAKNLQKNNLAYKVTIDKPTTILSILGWEGSAKFELVLENPKNTEVKKVSSDHAPIGIEFFAQDIGDWTVKIKPLSLPYPNFPFALILAKGGKKQQVINEKVTDNNTSKQSVPGSQQASPAIQVSTTTTPIIGTTNIQIQTQAQALLPPALFPILNMGGLPNYTVRWMPQAGQDGYILEEASSGYFADAIEVYTGQDTSWQSVKKKKGTYFYRISSYKASGKSAWSDVQSTVVLHETD